MSEKLVRPTISEKDSNFLKLLEWSDFLKKIKTDEETNGLSARGKRRFNGPDEGQIEGLLSNFYDSLKELDGAGALDSLTKMADLVEDRLEQNKRVAAVERPASDQSKFENIAKAYLPNVSLTRERSSGTKVISSYESGLNQLFRKKIWEVLIKAGKKQKRSDSKVLDDGIVIGRNGVTIFNPVGGDPREGEFVAWKNSAGLSFVVESPGILAPFNSIRRGLFGRPQPLAPIGLLQIFERSGQATDEEIPAKAQVVLRGPQNWVNMIEELRDTFGGDDRRDASQKTFVRPITWHDFVDAGLLFRDRVNSIRMMGILTNSVGNEDVEVARSWASQPIARRRR